MLTSRLQKEAPEPQDLLWMVLRACNQRGYHFRRRAIYRTFPLDFVDHEIRLVIELREDTPGRLSPDVAREHVLAADGYAVLRFRPADVAENLGEVAATISQVLEDNPPVAEFYQED